jgi:hypothetical protein
MQKLTLILFIVIILTSSCSMIRENHYFRDNVNDQAELANYYRVQVRGRTLLMSKTRYYSGYFDENSVERYFNEFTQPKDGQLLDSTNVQSLNADNANKQLVMILSSNADDFAAQIGNISQSGSTINAVLSIGNDGNYRKLLGVKSQIDELKRRNQVLADMGESLLDSLESRSPAQGRAALLQYVNNLAAELGVNQTFANLSAATAWYKQSQSTLLNFPR